MYYESEMLMNILSVQLFFTSGTVIVLKQIMHDTTDKIKI